MDQAAEWPIPIIATQDVACGVRVWSTAGKTRATVVVKATFFLVRGGPMRLVNPAPILLGDQHHEGSVDRSVLAPSDVAPYLPRAEVLFSGHAYAPTPSPFVPVRLAIVGSRPLVDKTLHVFGERMWVDGEQMTAPVPFTRIPVRYERAYRGHDGDDNPVGMAKGPGLPVHNIIDPSDPEAPAGFGAIAPYWPSRRRLLRNLDPAIALGPEPALPDTFAWTFFHTAPADQRCSFFEGNEWLVLEGLHAEHPRFESQLPGAHARARLYSLESTSHREVSLTADTLWIDGDRSMCCLLWRGNFEVEADTLANVQLFAGLELPGRAIPWPDVQPARTAAIAAAEPAPAPADLTMASIGGQAIAVAPPQPVGRATAQYSGQPAMPLSTPAAGEEPAGLAPSGSMLAALAKDPPNDVRDASSTASGYNQGQTLASPGVMAQAAVAAAEQINANRQRAAGPAQPPIAIAAAAHAEGAPPSAPIEVDPNWLEAGQVGVATSLVSPSEIPASGGSTMTSPPSELRALIRQSRSDEAGPPKTVAQPNFDDSPTVAPDTSDLERILEEADQQARADGDEAAAHEKAVPIGARPEPNQPRPQKTTIRGLGRSPSGSMPAVIEPPPATARVTTSHLMQGEEVPTAQLPVPEMLLKLAAQPSSQRVSPAQAEATLRVEAPAAPVRAEQTASIPLPPISQASPRIEERPRGVDLDEDDTGRPTLTGMEAPPVSQAQNQPQVHKGETRIEVERRIREGDALDGLDFSDLDLSGFDFSGKKLVNSRFDRANMRKCRLCGADLSGASLEGADLGETDLDDAVLERTNLVSAKLTGATLRRTFLTDANLTTADARRAVLDQASGQRTIFARTRLDGASAVGARLDSADFTEAQLDGASFENALLPELKAYEVSAEDTSFMRASLQNARFDGGVLGRARFDGASAEDSMWDRAVLDGASFESAKLCGGSFTKASLRGCNLNHADLGEARFNRANLNGASFVGVDLGSLTLDGADMTGVVTS